MILVPTGKNEIRAAIAIYITNDRAGLIRTQRGRRQLSRGTRQMLPGWRSKLLAAGRAIQQCRHGSESNKAPSIHQGDLIGKRFGGTYFY
jgi:hypothetical protein